MTNARTPSEDLTLGEFLNAVASRTPAPGGGAVTAAAGALACALGRMVAEYAVRKDTDDLSRRRVPTIADELRLADHLLRSLIDRDAEVYTELSTTHKYRGQSDDARRRWQQAVLDATAVPMQMAALAERALALLGDLLPFAGRMIMSDVGVAAVLAAAAAEAARFSISINLLDLEDRSLAAALAEEIDRICHHAEARRQAVVGAARGQLNPVPPAGR